MATRVPTLKQMGIQITAPSDRTILRAKETIDNVQQGRNSAQQTILSNAFATAMQRRVKPPGSAGNPIHRLRCRRTNVGCTHERRQPKLEIFQHGSSTTSAQQWSRIIMNCRVLPKILQTLSNKDFSSNSLLLKVFWEGCSCTSNRFRKSMPYPSPIRAPRQNSHQELRSRSIPARP